MLLNFEMLPNAGGIYTLEKYAEPDYGPFRATPAYAAEKICLVMVILYYVFNPGFFHDNDHYLYQVVRNY